MASTTVRLDEATYERLKAVKRPDESFSDAVDRLLSRGSLLDLVGVWSSDELTDVQAVLRAADEDAIDDIDALIERVDPE